MSGFFQNLGSPTWARTRDLRINSPSLYRLSYRGKSRDYSSENFLCKRESVRFTNLRDFFQKTVANLENPSPKPLGQGCGNAVAGLFQVVHGRCK